MFKKITLIIFSVLFLFGCSASPEPISNNADSYKNKVVFDSQTDSEKSIDLIQTSNSDSLAETETDNSELTSSALLVSDSDSTALENPQIAYSDGVFNKLHEELMKKYSDGYQSFSAESLIDIYGNGSDIEYFDDAIGLIAQNSYNQLFVLKNYSKENIEEFCSNITSPITDDSSIEDDITIKIYEFGDDIKVLCIGKSEFINDTKQIIENMIGGDLNG